MTVSVTRASGDTDLSVSGGASLTFTSANWNTPQTVTLAAAEDLDLANSSAVFNVTSTGLTAVSVTGTESDNDTQSLVVSSTSVSVTEGATNTFTVKLAFQPASNVTVSVNASGYAHVQVLSESSFVSFAVTCKVLIICESGGIRTPNQQSRNLSFYPVELRTQYFTQSYYYLSFFTKIFKYEFS